MKGYNLRAYDCENKRRFTNEISCELHISIETEDIDNKDVPSGYVFPMMTGYSFDMTVEQHVAGFTTGENKTANAGDFHDNSVHTLALERFVGQGPYDGQGTEVCYGQFYTESLSFKADNKKVITSILKFQGTGDLRVGNYASGVSTLSEDSEVSDNTEE